MHRSLLSMQDLALLSEQGLRLGTIEDAYFDPFEQRILGFAIAWEGELLRGPEDRLPLSQISELTADIVTVTNDRGISAGLEYDFAIETDGLIGAFGDLIGCRVSIAGQGPIGTLVDLQFDPQDGSVSAYEVAAAADEAAGAPTMMVRPRPAIAFQPGEIVLPAGARADFDRHPVHPERQPGSVAFVDAIEADDLVGEEDVEVIRGNTNPAY